MAVPWTPTTVLLHSILDGQPYTGTPNPSLLSLPENKEPDVFAIAFANIACTGKSENGFTASEANSSASNYPSIFSMRSEASSDTAGSELGFGDFCKLPTLTEENFAQLYPQQTTRAWTTEFNSIAEGDMAIGPFDLSSTVAEPHSGNQALNTLASIVPTAPIRRTRRPRRKRQPLSAEELQKKREAFLRRNRLAANKCRSRQRKQASSLETRAGDAQETKAKLEAEYQEALEEVMVLREAVRLRSGCCENWNLPLLAEDDGPIPMISSTGVAH